MTTQCKATEICDALRRCDGSSIQALKAVLGSSGTAVVAPDALRQCAIQSNVDLETLADSLGIPIYCSDLPNRWWQEDLGPFIVESKIEHARRYRAVIPNDHGIYQLCNDQGQVLLIRSHQAAESLGARAWFISPTIVELPSTPLSSATPLSIDSAEDRQTRLAHSVRSLFDLASTRWSRHLSALAGCLLASIALSFGTPGLLALIVDRALPMADQSFAIGCVALLLTLNLSQSSLVFLRNLVVLNAQAATTLPLQAAVTWRLLQSSISFFRSKRGGEIAHRSALISTTSWQVGSALAECLFTGLVTVSSVVVAGWLSPVLLLIAIPFSIVEAAWYYRLVRKIRKHAVELETTRSQQLGRAVKWLKAIALVKSSGIEAYASQDLSAIQKLAIDDEFKLQQIEDNRKLIALLLPALGFIIVLNAAYQLSLDQASPLTLGVIVGFIAAYRTFSMGLNGLATGFAEMASVRSQISLMRPLLEHKVENFTGLTRLVQLGGHFEFSNVTYVYPGTSSGIIDASFVLQPGELIGVLGASGSGKSTLLRLLLGLEAPQVGTIRVDGCISSSLDWHRIRRQIGSVLQSSRLFYGTIRENICNGRNYSDSHIRSVLESVELLDTIEALPMRLESLVTQAGANMSGGQCQRILLARAIIDSPKMLVLDEAMSGLDVGQQIRILKRLKTQSMTIVLISHRESSLQEADRILSIEQGRVTESLLQVSTTII